MEGTNAIQKVLNVALSHPVRLRAARGCGGVRNEEVSARYAELSGSVCDHVNSFAIMDTRSNEEVNCPL
eukprot:12494135-Alexandrium_andersonii.AAC.1